MTSSRTVVKVSEKILYLVLRAGLRSVKAVGELCIMAPVDSSSHLVYWELSTL